ncbi:MAG: ATP-binding protein, partial [Clostridiales bacterium]|nr:ATP-binding protein [Clostridiales bacterium]
MSEELIEKSCNVNKISIFKEIANNTLKPLEIIREAISNSIDAGSQNIQIEIGNEDGAYVLKIKDDGEGMSIPELEQFFSLGSSKEKGMQKIGEKGLGSITFFKSKRVEVFTQNVKGRYHAILDEPWKKIQLGEELNYTVRHLKSQEGMDGTEIRIHNYETNNLYNRHFNFDAMKDYILWFTAAGSFKTKFSFEKELRHLIKNINTTPMIRIIDTISGQTEEFVGEHRFSEPDENPLPSESNLFDRTDRYSKSFGPFHRSELFNGRYVSFQIFGTISGVEKRNEIIKFEQGQRHRSRYGLIFCKDFIPFLNMKELLLDDNNYSHYHLLLNSQNFELSSDRNNITNADSPEIQWILDEAKKIIREQITSVAKSTYFEMKFEDEINESIFKRKQEINKRIKKLDQISDILIPQVGNMKTPHNESQTLMIMATLLARHKIEGLRILEYSSLSSTDLILVNESGEQILAEVEYKLSS